MNISFRLAPLMFAAVVATACTVAVAPEPAPSPVADAPAAAAAPVVVAETAPAAATLPRMAVHRSASCGCCGSWVEKMEQAGYPVEVFNEEDLVPLKQALGVPDAMASCHTAIVEGYFIEGHVPADDVARLLMERPDARGLAVPGMPVGSPGMEAPSGEVQPYTVFLVNKDGSTTPFSEYGR